MIDVAGLWPMTTLRGLWLVGGAAAVGPTTEGSHEGVGNKDNAAKDPARRFKSLMWHACAIHLMRSRLLAHEEAFAPQKMVQDD